MLYQKKTQKRNILKEIFLKKSAVFMAILISCLLVGCSGETPGNISTEVETSDHVKETQDANNEDKVKSTKEAGNTKETEMMKKTETVMETETLEEEENVLDFLKKGDLFEAIGNEGGDISYTISPKAKQFINEHPELFPHEEDLVGVLEYVDYFVEYKKIAKNQDNYGDAVMDIPIAYVAAISETDIGNSDYVTELQVLDDNSNVYYVIYFGSLDDIYEDDIVEIYGVPVGMTSYSNISGGTTIAVVIAGCHIEKSL